MSRAINFSEQRAFYDENGYLIVDDVLTAEALQILYDACDELEEQAQSMTARTPGIRPRILPSGRRVIDVVKGAVCQHPAFLDVCRHSGVLDLVENLIGSNIQHHHSKLNWKPPLPPEIAAEGWKIEWHQDYVFFPHTNYDLLACAIMLDDATPENGCMRVIPGSHKLGPANHMQEGKFSGACQEPARFEDQATWQEVQVKAGGVSIHHGLMLHSSLPNLSQMARRALIIQYRAADNVQVGGRTSHMGWGMTVRGTNPATVRFENGDICSLPEGLISD